jgi:predicted dehydrogenase
MIKKNKKNILVVGSGSIGLRHINNLLNNGCDIGIYSYRQKIINGLENIVYEKKLDHIVLNKYDAIVIANNTDKHVEVAKMCVQANKPFYIEKPISHNFDNVDEVAKKVLEKGIFTKVGYMMRAHPNLVFLKNYLKHNKKDIYYVSLNIGQWLEDWRPGTDYRSCYSAHKNKGGGVIFDLIHELDIAYWLFGEIKEIFCFKNKVSKLEIDTEDFAQILLKSKKGYSIDIKLDYLRTNYKRDIEIVMDGSSISWDYEAGTVVLYDKALPKGKIIHKVSKNFDRNTMFEEIMSDFILELDGKAIDKDKCSFQEGVYSMMLAIKSHQSAECKKWLVV